jgi:uncharacterized damage-inducible protein DinB
MLKSEFQKEKAMYNRGSHYAQSFLMHRGALIDLLETLPPDKVDFTAWESGMSFLSSVNHLVGSSTRMLAKALSKTPDVIVPSSDWNTALANLKSNTQQVAETLSSLTEDQLDHTITNFGREMPAYMVFGFIAEHEAHHKGQMWLMARMAGLNPPMFIKLG